MILFKLHRRESIENKPSFILSDSIGLISFSISGALIAIEGSFNLTGVIIMTFLTAVGGGIVISHRSGLGSRGTWGRTQRP